MQSCEERSVPSLFLDNLVFSYEAETRNWYILGNHFEKAGVNIICKFTVEN